MVLQQLHLDLITLRDAAERALAAIDVLLGAPEHASDAAAPTPTVSARRPSRRTGSSARRILADIFHAHVGQRFTVAELLVQMRARGWETSSATATQYLQTILKREATQGTLTRTVENTAQGHAVIYYSARVKEGVAGV